MPTHEYPAAHYNIVHPSISIPHLNKSNSAYWLIKVGDQYYSGGHMHTFFVHDELSHHLSSNKEDATPIPKLSSGKVKYGLMDLGASEDDMAFEDIEMNEEEYTTHLRTELKDLKG